MAELKLCPKCNEKITLYSRFGVGVVAKCQKCKQEFVVCGVADLKLYNGCRIRKSTIGKIEKMWNNQATRTPKERGLMVE